MVLKIRVKKKNGKTYGLVTGITGSTLVNDLAKRYSRSWHITAFSSPSAGKPFLLLRRNAPLSRPYGTYIEWSKGKRKSQS